VSASPFHPETRPHQIFTQGGNPDRVTVVMTPFDRYGTFPKAVDDLYQHADHPFDLIAVESAAPPSVQIALESRKKRFQNVQILYSREPLLQPAARNLALAHIRTPWVFFLDNDVRCASGWLGSLVRNTRSLRASVIFPSVAPALLGRPAGLLERSARRRRAILISREAIDRLHGFDEDLDPAGAVADLALRAEATGLTCVDAGSPDITPFTVPQPFRLGRSDKTLFEAQWDPARTALSVRTLVSRWEGRSWDVARYLRDCERTANDRRNSKILLGLSAVGSLTAPIRGARSLFSLLART